MRIPSINSQAFKGLLVIPEGNCYGSTSPKIEIETDDIIEIPAL